MHIPDQESRGHISPTGSYFIVGALLLFLTVATVAASYKNWGADIGGGFALNISIAMAIATVKATLVLLYFMHMKYESKLVWGFGIAYPILLFCILLGFQVLDVPLRRNPRLPAAAHSLQQSPVGQAQTASR
ncbi:MAG: cytochrome C oxidase subunit IV family protein [Leptospirales bacterium]|nr:cytochrome C oxidase subunit IV family protein [Leptospirales bacterium]